MKFDRNRPEYTDEDFSTEIVGTKSNIQMISQSQKQERDKKMQELEFAKYL
eukprot:CAMPEP_0116893894 /NCGR_PEP_ID=MMETSP0467-20121206/3787_1 /TAXON_ID=283647 /ORGANISM="Mesodinium pulex, Strain SPMC105" /LENGTH=50 /DNA_ID=CAMNT_0004563819 /DNA_START=377 /DNA_END=529 /DNA_ORIENTATION=-